MILNKYKIATKRVFIGLIATVLVGIGLNGCDSTMEPTPSTADLPIVEESATPQALVTFFVEIPSDSPSDEPVLLSVLDEVTGLALNRQRYTMTVIDGVHYGVGVPATVGSVIKYRYSRQGDILAEEHISDSRPVRYRLYRVDGPGEVHDVITRWNDTAFSGPTGRITGTVFEAANGNPIPNILVTAGGAQALTAGDGNFFIEGLPPGTHNLVAYALDGSYTTFQQGATVASDSNTQASIQLSLAPRTDITFLVHIPEGTPPSVPLRLAGNLSFLGNTFANLSGGISTLASDMPTLSLLPDGSFGIILSLPIGSDLRYKYTLGDGFWNAERSTDGSIITRQIVVSEETSVVEDNIQTWSAGTTSPITFDINVPENTPLDEDIYIQFNPYGWTEPIPMWQLSEHRWAYILFSPIDLISELGYRYCRSGQCGHADDARTPGVFSSGQITYPSDEAIGVSDSIETWAWLVDELPQADVTDVKINSRSADFVTGFEFQPMFHPSWRSYYSDALQDIAARGGNQVIFPSSWTYTRLDPPVLEPVTGQNPMWSDVTTIVAQAKELNLNAALHAVPHFPTAVEAWWSSAPRDFAWWVSWFDRFETFALYHADLAEQSGTDTLILGGDWMTPALPDGKLVDGQISNVPLDADQRYRELIAKIRQRYSGTLAWALPYSKDITHPPGFIDEVDQIYVLWSAPLSQDQNAAPEILQAESERIINDELYALRLTWEPKSDVKSIVLSVAYPSVQGSFTGCLPDPIVTCLEPGALNFPAPDYPLLNTSFEQQAKAYDAVLAATNQYEWISGVVSRGYYPPAILHDKSTSVHGKPSADVLRYWFTRFTQPK